MIGDPQVRRVRYLYKVILRLHRGLPEELNKLGTAYVKDEFKRHKTCDVVTASRFLSGWTDYAIGLTKQLGITGLKSGKKLGQALDPEAIDHFNAEQVAQLYELKKVTHGLKEKMAEAVQENEPERRYPRRIRKSVVLEQFVKPPPPFRRNPTQSGQKSFKSRWKPEDQNKFNFCLETYGDQDVGLLTSKTAQKTPNSLVVYNYLQGHKGFAPKNDGDKHPKYQRLQKWVECIKDKKHKLPQPNPAALTMLLISLLEDHPVPTDDEVNFTEAYEFMFELLSGRNFNRHKKCLEGKYSEPTQKFIRLTVLSLLKETGVKMDVLHEKFVKSANNEGPIAEEDLRELPNHVRQLLEINHFNPLGLNVDTLTVDGDTAPARVEGYRIPFTDVDGPPGSP